MNFKDAGLTAADLTTWACLWNVIIGTVKNPYCLFLVASNIWNALNVIPQLLALAIALEQSPTRFRFGSEVNT